MAPANGVKFQPVTMDFERRSDTMKKLYYKIRRAWRWLTSREILAAINAGRTFEEVEAIARRGETA